MRIIGLDIHRAFAEAVAWENGKLRRLGRIDMRRDRLGAFAAGLSKEDVVVIEATGNAAAVAAMIGPYVKRVVIANPMQVRAIAHAKIKTDTIDAGASDATSGLTANATLGQVSDWIVAAGGTVILSETDEIIGAEHLLADRAASNEVRSKILGAVAAAEDLARFQGIQMWPLGEDNILGGLSTMEEKSMGAVRKGGTTPVREVVGYGERPSWKGPIFMDAPAPGVENIAALSAGGAQVILFTTGVGNPVGHPLVSTVKFTGNPETAESFRDNLDLDVAGLIRGDYDLDHAAMLLKRKLLESIDGELTRAEVIGDLELSISRVDIAYSKHRREVSRT